jgi:probable rRNA maturation factor
MLDLDLVSDTGSAINQPHLKQHLEKTLRRLNMVGKLRLEINLVGDEKIKTLNARFLGNDQPTDVLSFESPGVIIGEIKMLGSLVISTETAQKQAKEAGISLQNEVEMLAGHGLLHVLGYHHN